MVKVYLSRKGIPFAERNVSLDEEARKDLLEMGHREHPGNGDQRPEGGWVQPSETGGRARSKCNVGSRVQMTS